MRLSDIKAAATGAGADSARGHPAGEVLHQRRKLPFSLTTMTIAGLAITLGVGYVALYTKKKPEASAADVAKVASGTARPEDTHPRKVVYGTSRPEDTHPRK